MKTIINDKGITTYPGDVSLEIVGGTLVVRGADILHELAALREQLHVIVAQCESALRSTAARLDRLEHELAETRATLPAPAVLDVPTPAPKRKNLSRA